MRKVNGLLRYSQGTADDGLTVTGMAYSNKWNSTDQVPQRAIIGGDIGLYGEEDPTDGGNSDGFWVSARYASTDESGSWKANVFVIKSELDLFNNFTYFLTNPTLGDQFHQHDDRVLFGGNGSRTLNGEIAGLPTETTLGMQTREDIIDLGLTDTFQRAFLANIRSDKVNEGSVGIYAQGTVHWTPWFRTTLGWRCDYYAAKVDSIYDSNNSGSSQAAIGSPKFSAVWGPFYKTEFFLGAGMGMHSNDARGTTITEEPVDRVADPGAPSTPLGASPLLVRTRGAEVGVRTKLVPGLDSSLSVFILDQASELVFNGDGGDTSPSLPSRRYGIEWTNDYRPVSWLSFDGNLALAHARFIGFDTEQAALYASLAGFPQAQIGNALRERHSQRTRDRRLRRHHHRRKDRLVRRPALALSGCEPAHRGRRVSLAADEHLQRPRRLSLRERVADRARCAQSVQCQDQPDHLRLRIADQDRQSLQYVFPRDRRTHRARGGLPERRHGLRAAPHGAFGASTHAHGRILIGSRTLESRGICRVAWHYAVIRDQARASPPDTFRLGCPQEEIP